MSEITACPKCGVKYKTAGLPSGKKLKCKKCDAVFTVQDEESIPATQTAPPPRKAADEIDPEAKTVETPPRLHEEEGQSRTGKPVSVDASPSTFPCPKCSGEISKPDGETPDKIVCPHCNAEFDPWRDMPTGVLDRAAPVIDITIKDIEALWGESLSAGMTPGMTVKQEARGVKTPSHITVRPHKLVEATGKPIIPPPDYELLEVLGEGGMGIVYKARQTSIDRTIAVKMIKGSAAADKEMQAKFLSEAAVTGDLDHPNIVPIHDLGSNEQGHLFYAMKQVKGKSWKEVIKDKPLNENLQILLDVADAVAFAHSRNVIHRDLKPENVMLGDFGEVLVMDWGLAASVAEGGKAECITETTAIGGTPCYLAPEMAQGDASKIGPASDVYLLGAILYEIVTGLAPHTGRNVVECVYNAAQNVIQPTPMKGELVDIALRAMATDLIERYAGVKDFQAALRSYQEHFESVALATRAEEDLKQAEKSKDYDEYNKALFGFRQAFDLWKENKDAKRGVLKTRLAYAQCAFEKGDLDLAASMLHAKSKSHQKLAKQVEEARQEREARQQRVKTLTRLSVAAAAAIIVILSVAFFWIRAERERTRDERDKAITAKQAETKQRELADAARRKAEAARQSEAKQRLVAESEAKRAKAINEFMRKTLASADPGKLGREVTVREVMDDAAKRVDADFKDDPQVRADIHYTLADTYMALGQIKPAARHLQAALTLRKENFPADAPELLKARSLQGRLLLAQGRAAEAEKLFRKLLASAQRVLGKEHPSTLTGMNNLALALSNQGKYREAENLQRQVLSVMQRVLGKEHPSTLTSMNNLATTLHRQGKYREAENLNRQILAIEQRVLGKEHPSTLTSMNNLALALCRRGKYREAEKLYRQVLAKQKRILGKEYPNTLNSMNNLATALSDQGKYQEAEKLSLQVLAVMQRVLGKEHPDTLTCMGNLAMALSRQGKYQQAEKLQRQVLAARQRTLGKEHPGTLMSMNNLASALYHRGKYREAEKLYRQVLTAYERVLGKEHPHTLMSMNNLAAVLRDQGKYQEAEKLHRRVVAASERALGKEHPHTLASMNNLAAALSRQGKYREAEKLCRQVLAIQQRVLGKEHPSTLVSMNDLASTLSDQGKHREAEKLQRQVLAIQQRVLGKEHPHTLTSMNNLASALRRQGKYQEAENLQRQVLSVMQRVLGKEHPSTLTSMNNLATTLYYQRKFQEAEKLYRQVLATEKRILGKEHPSTLTSMSNLASTLFRMGKIEEAIKTLEAAVSLLPPATPAGLRKRLTGKLRQYRKALAERQK